MKLNLLIILIYLFPSTIHAQDFNTNYHPLACEYPENATISPSMIANYMLFYGSFDFSFLQRSTEGDVFHIGYQDYDRTAEKGQKAYFGAISYTDGEFTTDKLPINNKSTYINISPAKTGYILVTECFKKEKRLELRLEKINY